MIPRSIITIAVGQPFYLNLAENLLLSFLRWNQENNIHFLLLTDHYDFYKRYIQPGKVSVKAMQLSDEEKSFTSKFMLRDHAVAAENLFIDSDCLVYKDLTFVFDAFSGKSFSAIGSEITAGEFFCNVETTIKRFHIPVMPRFVGSVYYFRMDDVSRSIFEKAARLKTTYDQDGFIRLRNRENEEPLFAVAMASLGEAPIADTGFIKADVMCYRHIFSDVLSGAAVVRAPITSLPGSEMLKGRATPAILHFNGPFASEYLYQSEAFRLRHADRHSFTVMKSWLRFLLPGMLKKCTKTILRPVYRKLFGYRRVVKDQRST